MSEEKTEEKYKHFSIKQDNNIAWLTFDRNESNANVLSAEVLEELDNILIEIKTNILPKGLVFRSGKKNGFIAGADITQFKDISSAEEANKLMLQAQKIFSCLDNLSCPTIALITGYCLGGGLELALACDYRIALDDKKTSIGLPEVMLGIHPGWGGTVRLPRVIGVLKAMDLILSGRSLSARVASKIGVVDCAVPERHLLSAVNHYLSYKPEKIKPGFVDKILCLDFIRPIIGKILTKRVAKKVNPLHYPAPFAAIENWVEHSVYHENAYTAEAESIGKLMLSSTARNLVRVFFLKERLKGLAKKISFDPKHIHVIGAGTMGGDIAAWCALRGLKVTLQDQNTKILAAALGRANKLFVKKLKQDHLIKAATDRLTPDIDGLGISIADVIIEAIHEDLNAKKELFSNLLENAKSNAVLATNTSTIPLESIGESLNSARIVGIHFFNPVAQMPLVEVIASDSTDRQMVDFAMAFVGKIGKLPLLVKSSPGFLVNRILVPYLIESITLLEEGIPAVEIDQAALNFGMPMGPIELADTVGLDVCLAAAKGLNITLPEIIQKMVKDKLLGKKTGQGFYAYNKGKVVKPKVMGTGPQDISDRLIMRIMNESVSALREKIVEDADLLDAGLIFGAGFAPFRGGPMNYIKEQKTSVIKQRLEQLAARYGDRFVLDEWWTEAQS